MSYGPEPTPPTPAPRLGVLLTNLGTPEEPTARGLRPYLREFLGDPRVVEAPRAVWWAVLNLVIVPFRSPRSARLYANIWSPEGSPLLSTTLRQATAVARRLERRTGLKLPVVAAMRYGRPSLREGLGELRRQGCRRILVLPLYPQYSAATVGSTFDGVAAELMRWRWVPELRTIGSYHDHPGYIAALAASVRNFWAEVGEPSRLMMSFHGVPKRYADAGDPYPEQCRSTARLLAEALALPDDRWVMTFQSRFGREEWLQPYTDVTLEEWGKAGVRGVHVMCPGFSADCLETLEEIAITDREIFEHAGGSDFRYISALNDLPDHVEALVDLIADNLQGWL